MAEIGDLPLWIQLFLKAYRFRRAKWNAPAAVKPLREANLAIITTAGLHTHEQPPFDASIKSGDCSFRWIPGKVAVEDLLEAHRSKTFDHSGIEQDRNLGFPLDRFRELVAEGVVGRLNERHLSFMGSLTATGRLMSQSVPEAIAGLLQDRVDLAFLVPV